MLRTSVRILDGRSKLKQWKTAEKKKWKEANSEADAAAKTALKRHLKDSTPEALKVRKTAPFVCYVDAVGSSYAP